MVDVRSQIVSIARRLRRDATFPVVVPRRSVRLAELTDALDSAAAAVSTAPDIPDVLAAIVDAAKRYTRSEKVVLCLHGLSAEDGWLDSPDIVVRGRRSQHREEWWSNEIPPLADEAIASRRPRTLTIEPAGAWLLAVPIATFDEPIGVLVTINSLGHKLTEEHTAFLSVLGTFAAASIANARLAEQSRYALLAFERERIAREMHDGIAQSLFSISLGVNLCRRTLARNPAFVAQRLEEIQSQLHECMSEVRRYIYDLRPARLRELGLAEALRYWVKETFRDVGPTIEIAKLGNGALPGDVEACLYHIVREAVSNAVKHSGATRIRVDIVHQPDAVSATIEDDGAGFSPPAVERASASDDTHGLRTMHERAEALSGQLRIDSAPGQGCVVRALIPLHQRSLR